MATTYTIAELHDLTRRHFGLDPADLTPLEGEVDLNYRLTTRQGPGYTLKLSRPGQDEAIIRFQYDLLAHLAGKELPFATPVPVGDIVELPDGRLLRLLNWVPGRMLASVNPVTQSLRHQWGRVAGQLTAALADFSHPAAPADMRWNPSQTLDCRPLSRYMTAEQATLAYFFWDRFAADALPRLASLPRSVNYNDAHQHNLLVDAAGNISGVIDFGDAMYTHTLNELAIACAYAAMELPDPLGAMADLVAGYHRESPLCAEACDLLLHLVIARLLITVATAAENQQREPDNVYLQVSAAPAWRLLRRLRQLAPVLAATRFRTVCGLIKNRQLHPAHPVIDFDGKSWVTMDLSVGSLELGNNENFEDLNRFVRHIERHLEDEKAAYGVGGYGEARPVYTTDDFATEGNYGPRWRSVHLGVDVWGPVGTPVFAPYDGRVHSIGVDPTRGGYGNVIILQHELADGPIYSLYGHLAAATPASIRAGARVQRGDKIASFGAPAENGGWPPHLHLQLTTDLLDHSGDFPGVAYPADAAAWLALCPDPTPLLGLAPATTADKPDDLLPRRKNSLGYSLSVAYHRPLTVLRGAGQYLYDHSGRRFLDTVNNVAHVGHEHPRVVSALRRQAAVLNTNSRYLHPNLVAFAEELVATMPDGLSVVHFVNSGSEANELALRMCEQWSGTRNMLAVEVGYHGNTGRTIDVSGYKFDRKGGKGAPPTTRLLPLPDIFRGRHPGPVETAGAIYAAYAQRIIAEWQNEGQRVGGFIAESILSCGGQIVLPAGYLAEVYRHVRAAGGLCVADEVQVGVGRVGSHWWGFELQGVRPDIVTIGKPLGNGHPLGAVVCTPEVAASFANGMEYFNTFGGNPVSCAVGRTVLRIVREEGLMAHATTTGNYLKTLLGQLQDRHPIIGDVRGEGLFLGFELTTPSTSPAPAPIAIGAPQKNLGPATQQARYLKNRMRELGFLMSTDGPDDNVIKIKPPMCFDRHNADQLVAYLDRVLNEDGCR